jgi:hypothetical protein
VSTADLWGLFASLSKPTFAEQAQLPAIQIPGRSGNFLATRADDEAVFLLRGAKPSVPRPPLRLRHIEVDYGSRCRVKEEGATAVDGEFIAIRCVDVDVAGLELFVRTVDALIATLPVEPSSAQTESLIASIVELFHTLTQPARRSIKGLWAELFVIDRSTCPERAVIAWHAESDEKLDFVASTGYIEVKATEQAVRVHEFALAQLRGERSSNGFIASLRLRRAAGGIGILDLARRIGTRLNDKSLRAKLWGNVVEAMGKDFDQAADLAFDERFAETNALVIKAHDVPCISTPLPVGVLDARVVVDLSAIPAASKQGLSQLSRLFG